MGLISLITLIVFFAMAANIGTIKRQLKFLSNSIVIPHTGILTQAFKEEVKGNNKKAIDLYFDFLYDVLYEGKIMKDKNMSESIDWTKNKIIELGGKIPEKTEKIIAKKLGSSLTN